MDDRTLLEQIDAARGNDDELRAGGLAPLAERIAADERAADLYKRVQRADAALTSALGDVDVPADLEERLLVALKAARLEDVDEESGVRSQESGVRGQESAPPACCRDEQAVTELARVARRAAPRPFSLPRLVAALSVAAACVALCVMYLQRPQLVLAEEIAAQVQAMYDTEVANVDAAEWTMAANGAVAVSEEVSSALGFLHPSYQTVVRSRWLQVGDHEAAAYDLLGVPPQQVPPQFPRRVTLLVIDRRVTGLDFAPPSEPINTQGRCVGVWQSDRGHVFALVVEGTEDQYRGVLRRGHSIA
jgi:hypothetical protein